MSKIMLTVTETVEYRTEVEVTDDLLDEAAELGYPRTPSGVLEMLGDSDGEHDLVIETVHNDNAWVVYDRHASGRVA